MESLSRLLKSLTRRNLLPATMVLVMVALTFGCSKKSELVGRWENTTVQELIEFKPDNTGVIQGKNLPPLAFAWQEIAKHSYNLDVNFQGQKKGLKCIVQEGVMVLQGESGKETYRKVP